MMLNIQYINYIKVYICQDSIDTRKSRSNCLISGRPMPRFETRFLKYLLKIIAKLDYFSGKVPRLAFFIFQNFFIGRKFDITVFQNGSVFSVIFFQWLIFVETVLIFLRSFTQQLLHFIYASFLILEVDLSFSYLLEVLDLVIGAFQSFFSREMTVITSCMFFKGVWLFTLLKRYLSFSSTSIFSLFKDSSLKRSVR